MSTDWSPLGRALIVFGVVLMLAGAAVLITPKVPWSPSAGLADIGRLQDSSSCAFRARRVVGRLPGDVLIQRDRLTCYFPLASCLLASLVISLVLWLMGRFHQ